LPQSTSAKLNILQQDNATDGFLMSNRDNLHRFLFNTRGVRGELVQLDASYRAVIRERNYPDAIACQLGEALAAVSLLSATIKYQGSLILQTQAQGPLHTLVAQATHGRSIRGLARWHGSLSAAQGQALYGEGRLVITLEPEQGEPYQGIVALQSQSLSASLETYFEQSEQLSTRLWLAANQETAVGLLLQILPGSDQENAHWESIRTLAQTVTREELLSLDAETLLYRLFSEEGVRMLDSSPVAFRCQCSQERIANALRTFERSELEEILREEGQISVDCEFCNKHYAFDRVDLEALLSDKVTATPPQQTQ
jgi:molecular chaperone Hsp33